jgi:hypothetical protein
MKRSLWAPIVAVALAALIVVPTTFAVGEPGTTLYAQLRTNRFPSGQGAADASLTFNSARDIVLRISISGPASTVNAVRVYVDGTCTFPGEWVINRTPDAGPAGPFLTVNSNSGVNTIQVNQLDVDRIRSELAANRKEMFALMVARVIDGVNYRTCTRFRKRPFPPRTTTTTTATTPTTATTGTSTTRLSTAFSTGTTVQTLTLTGPGTTLTVNAGTLTSTVTGATTATNVFTSSDATTTFTGTSTVTLPVTFTVTQTVTATTVVVPPSTTLSTVTGTFSTPITTVTLGP